MTNESEPLLPTTAPSNGANATHKSEKEVVDPRKHVKSARGYFAKRRLRMALEQFYAQQDKLVEQYAEDEVHLCGEIVDRENHIRRCDAKEAQRRKVDRWLATLVFLLNIAMLAGNLIASILSGSYSVLAAFIDSSMDIVSSVVVFLTIWAIRHTNYFNYPRGRERLEIVSVICFSVIMGVANIMMIIQSAEAIIESRVDPDANLPTVLIILSGIVVKTMVGVVCYRHGTANSRILALDQRNDCITNLVALVGAWVGDNFWKLADPVGAIIVCTFIAASWFSNAFANIPLIVGKRAEQEHLSRILRIAMMHDERIICFDHLMVYHVGEKALVELHVVLDEHLPLKVTHDLTEALQHKIEALDFVERVFLHVDYRCDGHHDGK